MNPTHRMRRWAARGGLALVALVLLVALVFTRESGPGIP